MTLPRRHLILAAALALTGVVVWLVSEQATRTSGAAPEPQASSKRASSSVPVADPAVSRDGGAAPEREKPKGEAASSALPSQIEALLAQPQHQRPQMREVPAFDALVEEELIRRYRAIPSLGDKQHLLRILAYRGGEKSVDLLVKAMTVECRGRKLSYAEDTVMIFLPQLMGVLAREHDSARRFLEEARNPSFWTARRKWESDRGWYVDQVLAGSALRGLALTGTPAVHELLASYRSRSDDVARDLVGAIVTAAWMYRRVIEHGLEKTMDDILYRAGDLTDISAWAETDEGREWEKWAEGLRRRRGPDSQSNGTP